MRLRLPRHGTHSSIARRLEPISGPSHPLAGRCHMKLFASIWRDIEYIMDRLRKVNYYATADISCVALARGNGKCNGIYLRTAEPQSFFERSRGAGTGDIRGRFGSSLVSWS